MRKMWNKNLTVNAKEGIWGMASLFLVLEITEKGWKFKNKSLMLPLYDLNHGEGIRGEASYFCMPNNEYGLKKNIHLWKLLSKFLRKKIL